MSSRVNGREVHNRHGKHGRPPSVTGRLAALVAVLTAAALLLTLPDPPDVDQPELTAAVEPVSRTTLACPPGVADAVVKVASTAGLPPPSPSGGSVKVDLEPQGAPADRLTLERGELAPSEVDGPGLEVRGAGDAAQGLLAARAERVGSTLTVGGCRSAQPVWWFAGAGGGVDHSSVLFLTNVDEGPAVVDVRLHGATGSVDRAGTRGITLAPGETLRLPLAEVAPGSEELTVEVAAVRGRVVPHLLDSISLADGRGREWLPPAMPPAEDVVLAAVPAGADRVVLLVTNPGEDQALVDLEVLTEDGAFVPLGTEQVSVDPGSVKRVDLTEELEGRAAAVHLQSQVPVTGAVRSVSAGDAADAGSAAPLDVPSGVILAGDRSELVLAGGEDASSLELLLYAPDGKEVLRRGVTVPPSGLVVVRAPDGAAYAVLLPRSGDTYAAALHSRPGVAVQPVTPLPTTLTRPVVLPWTGQSDS
jgi:hypothetical protein